MQSNTLARRENKGKFILRILVKKSMEDQKQGPDTDPRPTEK
jgi:hypothetical protein